MKADVVDVLRGGDKLGECSNAVAGDEAVVRRGVQTETASALMTTREEERIC
jgi:hypothetical protein